jgi:hypothetical protein
MNLRGTLSGEALRQYVLAGRGTVTVRSVKTGQRFTFALGVPQDDKGMREDRHRPIFVKVLVGPDNTADYSYLGTLWTTAHGGMPAGFAHGRKSRIRHDAPSSKAAAWFFDRVLFDGDLSACEVNHEGRCGRCGRTLTVPESVADGFGPECIQMVGKAA